MRYYRGIRFDLKSDINDKTVYARKEIEDAKLAMRDAASAAKSLGNAEVANLLQEAHRRAEVVRLLLIQVQGKINR